MLRDTGQRPVWLANRGLCWTSSGRQSGYLWDTEILGVAPLPSASTLFPRDVKSCCLDVDCDSDASSKWLIITRYLRSFWLFFLALLPFSNVKVSMNSQKHRRHAGGVAWRVKLHYYWHVSKSKWFCTPEREGISQVCFSTRLMELVQ